MMDLYFTFGSDEKFPFTRGEYVKVTGNSKEECLAIFRAKYPDVTPGVLNCADYMPYEEFKDRPLYKDKTASAHLFIIDSVASCDEYGTMIYEEIRLKNAVSDLRDKIDEAIEDGKSPDLLESMIEADYIYLAKRYLDSYVTGISADRQWDALIDKYIDERRCA